MSEKQKRDKDRERINELYGMIEPARNEYIAREALDIASKWLGKAEKQAKTLVELQKARPVRCEDCKEYQTDWEPSVPNRHFCATMDSFMRSEDYCSYGERKE